MRPTFWHVLLLVLCVTLIAGLSGRVAVTNTMAIEMSMMESTMQDMGCVSDTQGNPCDAAMAICATGCVPLGAVAPAEGPRLTALAADLPSDALRSDLRSGLVDPPRLPPPRTTDIA